MAGPPHPPQEVLVAHRGRASPDHSVLGPNGNLLVAMSDDEATHPESDGSAHEKYEHRSKVATQKKS